MFRDVLEAGFASLLVHIVGLVLFFLAVLFLMSLGGCCYASSETFSGEQRSSVEILSQGKLQDEGREYGSGADARRLETLNGLPQSPDGVEAER